MQTQKKQIAGFSLLELILALAVLSVIVTLGLAAYNQKVLNDQVERSALQIQLYLQAGMAFYVDNNRWPNQNNPSEIINYLPQGIANNPWGNAYNYSAAGDDNALFEVTTRVPSLRSVSAQNLATLIANRLPAASVNAITGTVTAQVNIPGQASNLPDGDEQIVGVQSIASQNSGSAIEVFQCPSGFNRSVVTMPSAFVASTPSRPSVPSRIASLSMNQTGSNTYRVDLDRGEVVSGPRVLHKGRFVAITVCRRISNKKNKVNATLNNKKQNDFRF